jgi:hypothetical protein
MTDPFVFYRKKKGRKLILYLKRKLVRKNGRAKDGDGIGLILILDRML